MPQKRTKSKKAPKARSKDKGTPLDKHLVQKAAANALLSLSPNALSSMCKGMDPDVAYDLVYAAANQTLQHFEGVSHAGGIRPPTKMRVAVEHDPSLSKTEIQYSFTESKFTIFTPEDLTESVSAGDQKITKEESLRNTLSESLPSAQFKLFFNQGHLLANGDEEAYRKRFLPQQFKETNSRERRTSKPRRKK